ncbi:MAG: hypothetical protein WCB10_03660 [Steroidobacteraceae bacterium]
MIDPGETQANDASNARIKEEKELLNGEYYSLLGKPLIGWSPRRLRTSYVPLAAAFSDAPAPAVADRNL